MTRISFVLTILVALYALNAMITPCILLMRRPGSFVPYVQHLVMQRFGGTNGWTIQNSHVPCSEVLIQRLLDARMSSEVDPAILRRCNRQQLEEHVDSRNTPSLRLDVDAILQATDADDESFPVKSIHTEIELPDIVNPRVDEDTTQRLLGATERMLHSSSSSITTDMTSMDKLSIGLLREIYRYTDIQGLWPRNDTIHSKLGYYLLEDSVVGIAAPLAFRFLAFILNKDKYQLEWLIESLEHALMERLLYWRDIVSTMETDRDE